ncbi:glycosyltransferase [Dethiosulfatarculus sandiegensis]|uniref:Glycosyl transferase family 1 domain-containing protein n=1 Tax=Dethiosulfatarculus sandiegensis TaxID=1429043 RepID=A0A0D2K176_9BACT|nr:glycosyltransferase [Dethiosulfatarculus sandiegensis]KIX15435.1 hypothetical protein X474_03845 [Dethiosulfatarculus sandiegensis]
MIYYFLPDPGIAGGVKVAFQFLEALTQLGVRAVAALPGTQAPQWFTSSVAVVNRKTALQNLTARDHAIITWPPDYEILREKKAKLVFHCQGVENLDAILRDKDIFILTCWEDTKNLAREKYGRESVMVGISVSTCFFERQVPKKDNRVTYMPRRGLKHALKCLKIKGLDFEPLDGLSEGQVALKMQQAGIYLATSVGEDFGLPALEAMAAGCLVVSVPVLGGMEYLTHSQNAIIAETENLASALFEITRPGKTEQRELLRQRAVATAHNYHPRLLKNRLSRLLQNELREFVQ